MVSVVCAEFRYAECHSLYLCHKFIAGANFLSEIASLSELNLVCERTLTGWNLFKTIFASSLTFRSKKVECLPLGRRV